MNFKQKFKENKGITLIALVVTIIVLLILAGISIAMLTGQNGILNRATEAKNTTGTAQVDEQVKLSVAEALSNGLGTITEENLTKALNSNVGSGKYELTGDAVNGWTIKAADKTYNISVKGETSGEDNEEVDDEAYIDDNYVDYNVAYKDIYTGNDYTNLTGWRLLNKVDNADGTSNIEIISTGTPAGLYYEGSYITNSTYNVWAGTDLQVTDYANRYYTSGSKKNANMYAVSGLRYNFEKIKFKKQSGETTSENKEYNLGYYTSISKDGVKQIDEIDGSVFKLKNNVEVRSVMLSDINGDEKSSSTNISDPIDKKGLFILQNYTPDVHNTNSYYLLASPNPYHDSSICFVYNNGETYYASGGTISYFGVRPVVSMTSIEMQRKPGNRHVWEIID